LICYDALGENMAGPGIRYWEFARVLSQYFTVTLAIPPIIQQEKLPTLPFEAEIIQCKKASELYALAKRADVIVTIGFVILFYPTLLNLNKPLVLDIYVPTLLENVQLQSGLSQPLHKKLFFHEKQRNSINTQLRAADFMICASEKQRDYWLGLLSALGRVNPYTYEDDKTLRRLIDVVPFGLPKEKPVQTRPVLKGVYKTIQPDDQVLLWTGGIWDWLDAPTLIKAMPHVISQSPKVKLFFMGIKRPLLSMTASTTESIELSQKNGLYNTHIFFNDWVPYEERQNYLLEADLGVSLHLNHIETRFSFRTRFLDHLWTGLPSVATEGDILSAELEQLGLGRTVKVGDVMGVAQAILEMLSDSSWRERYEAKRADIIARYQWESVIQPLLDFCAHPYFAPDKAYLQRTPLIEVGATRYWQLPQKAWKAYWSNGLGGFWWQLNRYVVWKLKTLKS
jgi:glycosyltransferase involved in cell wall biosynthesis